MKPTRINYINSVLRMCPQCKTKNLQETVYHNHTTTENREDSLEIITNRTSLSCLVCLHCHHQFEESSTWSDTVYPRGDGSLNWLEKRARLLVQRHKPQALEALLELSAHKPGWRDIQLLIARTAGLKPDDPSQVAIAVDSWRKLLEVDPDNPEYLADYLRFLKPMLLAQDWVQYPQRRYLNAHVVAFGTVDALGAETVRIGAQLGNLLALAGTNLQIETNLGDYGAIIPGDSPHRAVVIGAYLLAARAARTRFDFKTAQSMVSKAFAQGIDTPQLAPANVEQALNYEAQGHTALAATSLRASLAEEPDSTVIQLYLARCLWAEHKTSEATAMLQALAVGSPDWPVAWLCEKLRADNAAERSFLQAVADHDADIEERRLASAFLAGLTNPWIAENTVAGQIRCPFCSAEIVPHTMSQAKQVCAQEEQNHQAYSKVWYRTRLRRHCPNCHKTWFDESISIAYQTEL